MSSIEYCSNMRLIYSSQASVKLVLKLLTRVFLVNYNHFLHYLNFIWIKSVIFIVQLNGYVNRYVLSWTFLKFESSLIHAIHGNKKKCTTNCF